MWGGCVSVLSSVPLCRVRDCQNVMNAPQDAAAHSDSFRQFEGGVKLGIGSFNLVGGGGLGCLGLVSWL